MKRSRILAARLLAPLLFLVVSACGVARDDPEAADAHAAHSELVGELVDVVFADGRTTLGVAVLITSPDGSTQVGYFRGPRPLADATSEGTWTFPDDALPARVRLLEPRESLRRREG